MVGTSLTWTASLPAIVPARLANKYSLDKGVMMQIHETLEIQSGNVWFNIAKLGLAPRGVGGEGLWFPINLQPANKKSRTVMQPSHLPIPLSIAISTSPQSKQTLDYCRHLKYRSTLYTVHGPMSLTPPAAHTHNSEITRLEYIFLYKACDLNPTACNDQYMHNAILHTNPNSNAGIVTQE